MSLLPSEIRPFQPAASWLAVLLCALVAPTAMAKDSDPSDPLQFSIGAVTRADNCLYMLQATRDPDTGDCEALRNFHEERFLDWSPNLDELDDSVRRRVLGNRQTYLQTLEDIARERQRLN
jgi:hypothetical protein